MLRFPGKNMRLTLARGQGLLIAALLLALVGLCVPCFYPGTFRWAALRTLAVCYAVFDPWTNVQLPPTGLNAEPGWENSVPMAALVDRHPFLDWASADVNVETTPSQVNVPFFHPETIESDAAKAFRQRAETLLSDNPDPWQLSNRVRWYAPHGITSVAEASNPQVLIEALLQGRPLSCRQFSILHAELCSMRGYVARVLGLSSDGLGFNHAVSEVYVPEYGWILIDCDFNIAYRRNGRWLNAWDLHRAWWDWRQKNSSGPPPLESLGIELVILGQNGAAHRTSNLRPFDPDVLANLPFYEYVFYPARSNYLSGQYPKGHPIRTGQWVLKCPETPHPAVAPEAWIPNDIGRELYWPVGEVAIRAGSLEESATKANLELYFSTWMPNFAHFEVQDGETTCVSANGHYTWQLTVGRNRLVVVAVTSTGLRGRPTTIELNFGRPTDPDKEPADTEP